MWQFGLVGGVRLSRSVEIKAPAKALRELTGDASTTGRKHVEIGRSNKDAPIFASMYGEGEKCVVVIGGVHGNEPSSVTLARALDASLQINEIPADLTVIVVQGVNPDGLASNTRLNARGVDINRNFPSTSWSRKAARERFQPGDEPASEPETRAVMKLINLYQPKLIISIHSPLACVNWDGPAEETARVISYISGYPLRRDVGYDTPGSLGSYAGIDLQIPTITFEVHVNETDEQTSRNIEAIQAALAHIASK